MDEVDANAKIIWEYMLLHQPLTRADAILALGSNDTRVAERAAELYHLRYSDMVICAGGQGKGSLFDRPEAEVFAEIVIARGVPKERVLLERESSNTGENIEFVKRLIAAEHLPLHSFLVVTKPYRERRAWATFRKQWPEAAVVVTSPQFYSYEDYEPEGDSRQRFINAMVGDLQRIKEYPAMGFQIEQEIPPQVWGAYERLVALGFTKYRIPA